MFCTIKTMCVPIVQCNVSPHFVIVNLPIHIMELPARWSQWPVTPEHSTPCGSQFLVNFFYETNTSKRFHMHKCLFVNIIIVHLNIANIFCIWINHTMTIFTHSIWGGGQHFTWQTPLLYKTSLFIRPKNSWQKCHNHKNMAVSFQLTL